MSEEIHLSEEQHRILKEILNDDSIVFVTGSAGTGKSVLLRAIYHEAKEKGINVRTAAPTGTAAFIIPNGTTYHRLFGIGIKKELNAMIASAKWNLNEIKSLQMVIIDEVSMISGEMLDNINAMLQKLRRNPQPFGGIRMIFFGDFYQLAPIEEEFYAFESDVWKNSVKKTFVLTQIYRQKDELFIKGLESIRRGCINDAAKEIISICSRNKISDDATKIFSRRDRVKKLNEEKLKLLSTPPVLYSGKDSENAEDYKSFFPVDRDITLKIGAKVMLKKNMPLLDLFNGSVGIVTETNEDHVNVQFNGHNGDIPILAIKMDINAKDGTVLAWRKALPLILAWACTAHTIQGASLDEAEIDGTQTFADGQFYVMVSRVRYIGGLFIKNFRSGHVRCNNRVTEFYEGLNKNFK
jgi:ATP-dependent exoDNAse (exonuclease V) alpha subunit